MSVDQSTTRAAVREDLPVREGVEFRFIPGWPGYAVGDDGTVWSCKRPAGRVWKTDGCWKQLKPHTTPKGYRSVNLCNCGESRIVFVHVLVLELFVGPCPRGMQCRHFPDQDKSNNRRENLSWGTPSQNVMDSESIGNHYGFHHPDGAKKRFTNLKLSDEQVDELRNVAETDKHSLKTLAGVFGISISYASRLRSKARRPHKIGGEE